LVDTDAPPAVDRSSKPPPVCRTNKPSQDHTNLAPPVDRACKPALTRPSGDEPHSYENMGLPVRRGTMTKSHSMPETDVRNYQQETDYFDMQPYRSEDTRCYSFSRDHHVTTDCYEDMEPQAINRESGVHSNSSSDEGGDTEECYMAMGPPDQLVSIHVRYNC